MKTTHPGLCVAGSMGVEVGQMCAGVEIKGKSGGSRHTRAYPDCVGTKWEQEML